MLALGMMSGTSLDGVDAALVETDGVEVGALGRGAVRAFSGNEAAVLKGALGRWPGEAGVAEAAAVTLAAHAEAAAAFPEAEVVGFHGQTLAHDPDGRRATHQAGDGAALARAVGRRVVWDFRAEDVRRGGQGAPLVPFFHHALMVRAVALGALPAAPVAVLNLGGVGNLTWCDPLKDAVDGCLAFDTGPANAPINDLMAARRGALRDDGGALAAAGWVDAAVIDGALESAFFARRPPKSLDRDAFAGVSVAHLDDADAAATLTALAAAAVAEGWRWLPEPPATVLVGGGGRHNAALMAALSARLPAEVAPVEAVGLDGDLLEAQAFGWLAVRVLRGLPTSGPMTTGVPGPCCGGRISAPR